MENEYVDALIVNKALIIGSKLGLYSFPYTKSVQLEQLTEKDSVIFNNLKRTIERDLTLLSCSEEKIDRQISEISKTFNITTVQAQNLCYEQSSFLHTSKENWESSIKTIEDIFGKKITDFSSLVSFSKIMFRENKNIEKAVQEFESIGIDRDYSFNNPSILSATEYSIKAKYMFGVVNGLEEYNLPNRQDLIRQNLNKTIARYRYLEKINKALQINGIKTFDTKIIFDRQNTFLTKINRTLSENSNLLDYVEKYKDEGFMLDIYKPDAKYYQELQKRYQEVSTVTFEGDNLKYPLLVLSQEQIQNIIDSKKPSKNEESDKKAKELQKTLNISLDSARTVIKQNPTLLIYSGESLKSKMEEWSKFFDKTPKEVIDRLMKRPNLFNYDLSTIIQKSTVISKTLKCDYNKFIPILFDNLEIATQDTDKVVKKIETLQSLNYSDQHILDNLKEVTRLSYGTVEKFMITQIASRLDYQNPRVKGQYQDFNKYFFQHPNVDKIGRCSLPMLYAKFRFFYDGMKSEESDKLVVPQSFNTYFINTKDMIKQYAKTIGSEIEGFEIDKNRILLKDIPELELKAGTEFDDYYKYLQAELIKKYPFDDKAYELLLSEYSQLENVPPITFTKQEEVRVCQTPEKENIQTPIILDEETKQETISQAQRVIQNLIDGGKSLDE